MFDNLSETSLGQSRPTWVTSKNLKFSRLQNPHYNYHTITWCLMKIVGNMEEASPEMSKLTPHQLEKWQNALDETEMVLARDGSDGRDSRDGSDGTW